jgi:hypothetical protein
MKHGGGQYQRQDSESYRHHQRENAAHHSARLAFHKPHTSLGSAGHWVRMAAILSPLIIGEFIKDPATKWRAVRLATVATALLTEGMWTHKIGKDREAAKEKALQCTEELAGACGGGMGPGV